MKFKFNVKINHVGFLFFHLYLFVLFWLSVFQGNPILGVHIYLYSDDVSEVECLQGSGNGPRQDVALCHAVSDADGKFTFNSIPCGNLSLSPLCVCFFLYIRTKI